MHLANGMEKLGFVEGESVGLKGEGSKRAKIWILPGMEKVDEKLEISLWGDSAGH